MTGAFGRSVAALATADVCPGAVPARVEAREGAEGGGAIKFIRYGYSPDAEDPFRANEQARRK